MRIYVNIHPESSVAAFEVLDQFRELAGAKGVDVIIERSLDAPVGDN
jgi:hypothetical protein